MRNIPPVTRNLLVINVVCFLAMLLLGSRADLNDICGLHFFMASNFHVYQFITYMFMHGGWSHLFFNMFALWMFGCVVERTWGSRRFLVYYFVCGIGAGLFQELAQFVNYSLQGLAAYDYVLLAEGQRITTDAYLSLWTTVGASGAIYGILLAFGLLYPNERIFIFPLPVPIKAKWFVFIYAALELLLAFSSSGDGVAHLAHLGGMAFGFLLILYWRSHPYAGMGLGGERFFNNMRRRWEDRQREKRESSASRREGDGWNEAARNPDWDYNATQRERQAEVDRILEKIRRSGYDSLTAREKQTLFDESKR